MNRANEVINIFKHLIGDQFPSIHGYKCTWKPQEQKIYLTVCCRETDFLADCLTAEFDINYYLYELSQWFGYEVEFIIGPIIDAYMPSQMRNLALAC